ncbi:hypothetical protein [Nocardia sp. NPDC004604]|uniref:hypothetical protein n=1 Tax=Nocardia sp. NPDC004604 TaxID=3157013 RepID=UPI0033A80F15
MSDQVEPNSYSIRAACGEASADRKVAITARPVRTTTTTTTTKPITTTTTQPSVPETSTTKGSIAAPSRDDPQPNSHIRDLLGIGAFLLAVGVAALVLRQRRRHPVDAPREHNRDPRTPQVRVQVVGNPSPSIHLREFTHPTAPAVHIRLSVGEPQLHVREVSR